MKRRAIVFGTGAAVAAAAGIGAGMRSASRDQDRDAASLPLDPWTMSFTSLDGSALALSGLRGRPLLLNFWATWCAPCATEMPLLDRFAVSQQAGRWNVLALGVDDREAIRRFMTERGLRLRVAIAGADGLDLSRALGNTAGALPYTVVFSTSGSAAGRRLGILDEAMLAHWVDTVT